MSIEAFIKQGDWILWHDDFFAEFFDEAIGVIHGVELQRHYEQREDAVKTLKAMGPEAVTELVNRGADTSAFHKVLLLADRGPAASGDYAVAWAEFKAQSLPVSGRSEESETPHPYKLYFAEYCEKNPGVANIKAAAAKAYWATKLDKNERKEYADEKAFVRSFKYYLNK